MSHGNEALQLSPKTTSDDLVALYSQTVFLFRPLNDRHLPNPFAIITASNPLGQLLSDVENTERNQSLKSELANVLHEDIIGASVDLNHQEQSFIVQISKPAAIGLALKYDQNAIYWVEGDDLHIVPVAMSGDEISIGSFRQRLVKS